MFNTITQNMQNIYKIRSITRTTAEYNQKDMSYPWITLKENQQVKLLNTQEETNWNKSNNTKIEKML